MENCEEINALSCIDRNNLNCDVFNASPCVDSDMILLESLEEVVRKTLLIFPFFFFLYLLLVILCYWMYVCIVL